MSAARSRNALSRLKPAPCRWRRFTRLPPPVCRLIYCRPTCSGDCHLIRLCRLRGLAVLRLTRGTKARKLGATLLSDALLRADRAEMGVFALVVDAKDEAAEAFYLHYGFMLLAPRQLFLPLATAKKR